MDENTPAMEPLVQRDQQLSAVASQLVDGLAESVVARGNEAAAAAQQISADIMSVLKGKGTQAKALAKQLGGAVMDQVAQRGVLPQAYLDQILAVVNQAAQTGPTGPMPAVQATQNLTAPTGPMPVGEPSPAVQFTGPTGPSGPTPPVGPSINVWYTGAPPHGNCTCYPLTGEQKPYSPTDVLIGTFADMASAIAAVFACGQQHAKDCGLPPPPPPPPAQGPAYDVYILCQGQNSSVSVCASTDIGCLNNILGQGGVHVAGPFATADAANAWIAANGALIGAWCAVPPPIKPPPPPPPPPGEKCPPCPPVVKCPPPPGGGPGINIQCTDHGEVGLEPWCGQIESIANDLAAVGQSLVTLAGALPQQPADIPTALPQTIVDALNALTGGLGDLLNSVYAFGADVWNALINTMYASVQVGVKLTHCAGCFKPDVLVGCIVCRGMAHALRSLSIGVNVGMQSSFSLDIQWEQADAIIDYVIKWLCPVVIPDPGTAIQLFAKQWISEELYTCWMRCGGHDTTVWSHALRAAKGQPGIGDRQQFLYRLYSQSSVTGLPYTDAEFEAQLQHDGYVEEDINRLMAIRYRVLSLREVQRLMDTGVIDQTQLEVALRAEGFSPPDVQLLIKMEQVIYARRHEAEIQGLTPQRIKALYSEGVIQDTDVYTNMGLLGYSGADADKLMSAAKLEDDGREIRKWGQTAISAMSTALEKAYKAGLSTGDYVLQALTSVGAGADAVQLLLQAWQIDVNLAQNNQAMACIRRGWESGYLTEVEAIEELVLTGQPGPTAASNVGSWNACRNEDQKLLTAGEILAALKDGLLDPPAAMIRLQALGFAVDTAQIKVQMVVNALEAASARAEQAALKAQEAEAAKQHKADLLSQHQAQVAAAKAAKAAEALAKQADAAKRAAVAELRRLTPPALLDSLLKDGMISVDAYTERMQLLGYDADSITLQIAKVCNAGTASCVQSSGQYDDAALNSGEEGSGTGGNPPSGGDGMPGGGVPPGPTDGSGGATA